MVCHWQMLGERLQILASESPVANGPRFGSLAAGRFASRRG
jgi:hypothetical protein